jgi:hypothetical protein
MLPLMEPIMRPAIGDAIMDKCPWRWCLQAPTGFPPRPVALAVSECGLCECIAVRWLLTAITPNLSNKRSF